MLAARIVKPYTVDFVERDIPKMAEDEVLVKVAYLGICGSDMHTYHGEHPFAVYPVIPGHEVSGVVEKKGKDVRGFEAGDKVLLYPHLVCGECYSCKTGHYNVCETMRTRGVHLDGSATSYIITKGFYLIKAPADMDLSIIPLAEPLGVGIASVKRAGPAYKGANIAIVGAGTIGNMVAQSAKALGAGKVLVTDVQQNKLDYAKECGIDACINTKEITLKEAIIKAFGPERKADIIIDCAANKFVFNSILEAARKRSTIIITGNYNEPVSLNVPVIQRQEISLVGHIIYLKEDLEQAIDLLYHSKIHTEGFITQRWNLNEIDKAFDYGCQHPDKVLKQMVKVNCDG